jgi:hypothetical protein
MHAPSRGYTLYAMSAFDQRRAPHHEVRRWLAWSAVATVVLYVIPFGRLLAWPLVLLSSFVHELGHGTVAVLVGADFQSLQVFPDASGVARHAGSPGRLAQAAIAMGGLVGPSFAAAAGYLSARTSSWSRAARSLLAFALVVLSVTVLRGFTTFAFVAMLLALAAWIVCKATPTQTQFATAFLATQLALSVLSRADYLFTDVAQTGSGTMPSDVAVMASSLVGPYWFWGAICGVVSLAVTGTGLWLAGRAPRPRRPRRSRGWTFRRSESK